MRLIYEIVPLIGVGLNVILVVLVLRRHPRSPVHQVFSLFLTMMGLWAFTIYGMRTSPTLDAALPWQKAVIATLPFVSVSFYYFVLTFTGRKHGWQPVAAYSVAAVFALVSVRTDWLIAGMKEMWYGHGFLFGPLMPPYIVIFYGFVLASLFMMLKTRRFMKSGVQRSRYLYIVTGAGLCIVGLLGDILAAIGVGMYPLGMFSNIAFSALCGYAITRHQLLDIHLVLRRGTAYALVSAVVVGLYLGLATLAYVFFTRTWTMNIWLNVSFAMLIAVMLQPVLRQAQDMVDRWFYRDRYDYLNALESLGQETSTISDLNLMAASMVKTVASAMRCRTIAVMLPESGGGDFVPVSSRGAANHPSLRLSQRGALVRWLAQHEKRLTRQEIEMMPQLQGLTVREAELLAKLDAQLLVPLVTRDGLRGILVLGRKLSGQDYTLADRRTLRVVARQMAISLDNARLYHAEHRARLEMETQNREQVDFMNALLHEVRTPITAILVSSELLRDELAAAPSVIADLAQNLDVAARSLDRRISELVDFGRLHSTGIKLDLQPVDPAGVAKEAAAHVIGLLLSKQQTLELDVAGAPVIIRADPQRLLQVWLNLLTNASKFSAAGKAIRLRAHTSGGSLIGEVHDSAAPIAENVLRRLFKPYQQGGNGSGGLGLGLSICRKLVQLHGGKIWVERDGTGNKFKFSLPLAREE